MGNRWLLGSTGSLLSLGDGGAEEDWRVWCLRRGLVARQGGSRIVIGGVWVEGVGAEAGLGDLSGVARM